MASSSTETNAVMAINNEETVMTPQSQPSFRLNPNAIPFSREALTPWSPPPFRLNPNAVPYSRWADTLEAWSLYLTFSDGYPIREVEIRNFFKRRYGDCVETVAVDPYQPLFGRIVFDSTEIPAIVLNGRKKAKFVINGRPLWCTKFIMRRKDRV